MWRQHVQKVRLPSDAMRNYHSFLNRVRTSLTLRVATPALIAAVIAAGLSLTAFLQAQNNVNSLAREARLHDESMIALGSMKEATLRMRYSIRHMIESGTPSSFLGFESAWAEAQSEHDWSRDTHVSAESGTPEEDSATFREQERLYAESEEILMALGERVQGLVDQGVIMPGRGAVGVDLDLFMDEVESEIGRMQAIDDRIESLLEVDREKTLRDQEVAARNANLIALGATGAAMLAGLGAAFFFARRLVSPVRQMAAAARRMADGDLAQQVDASGSSELSRLGRTFNTMARALDERTRQLEREKANIRSIHQSIGDGIIVLDNAGVIASLNPAAEKALGRTAIELEGGKEVGVPALQELISLPSITPPEMRKCWEVKQCTHPECPSYESDDLRCWLQCGTYCHNQIQGTFRQKRDACERCDVFQANAVRQAELTLEGRRFSCGIIPVLDDEGQQVGRSVVLHDITEIHDTKKKLEKHSAELEELQGLTSAVTGTLDLEDTLKAGVGKIYKGGRFDAVAVFLLDEEGEGRLRLSAVEGFDSDAPEDLMFLDRRTAPIGVLESGEAIVFSDLRRLRRCPASLVGTGMRSAAIVPLKAEAGSVLGVLCLAKKQFDAFSEDDLRLLRLMAAQMSIAARNAMLYEERVRYSEQMLARNRIVSTLTSSLMFEDVFDTFAQEVRKLADYDRLSVTLLDENYARIEAIVAEKGAPLERGDRFPLPGSVLEWIVEHKEPVLRDDLLDEMRFSWDEMLAGTGVRSCANLPLIVKNRVIGTLNLCSLEKGHIDDGVVRELRPIVDQLALTLANQELFRHVAAAKAEWETTFDAVAEGIVVVDSEHRIVRLNRSAARMLGGSVKDFTGEPCRARFHGIICQDDACALAHSSPGMETVKFESGPANGRIFEVAIDPIFDNQGSFTGGVHFLRDITESKQMRQRMMTSEKMVAVGQLVSGVAHEINNPLTGITGYAQLLMMRDDIDEKTKKDAEAIAHEADRATRIVRQLLSFARKHQPERQPVNINEVIRDCVGLKGYDLKVNNVTLRTDLDSDLPEIAADRYQLQQVFLNLITNAEQAIHEQGKAGTLEISSSADSGIVRIAFTDSGPGIPAEIRNRLFDPFFTTKDVGKGTGLGLSVCYGIVEEHQGSIWAEGAPSGAGARFVVELPVGTVESGMLGPAEGVAAPVSGRVLLVDDEQSVREVLAETLRRVGHEVDVAGNGDDALKLIGTNDYDCVISDIKMPVMNGADLHLAVKSVNPDVAACFIFISGDTVNEETRKYLEEIGNPSLVKPFSLQALEEELQKMLRGRRKAA
ncbi:MAG: GAF domain-containing protein [Gaiellales bacterium]|nr:MAG: GAF domain-containing protein [Gaiellales bacterium]